MFNKFNLSIVGAIATIGFSGAAEALTVVPTDLNPGDQYRLVFVTNSTRAANSTNIADYNQFVTNDVTGSTLATELGLAGLTPDWFAIASTSSTSARDNTSTQGTTDIPIYLISGERVADGYGDLWDGTIQTAIDTTPTDTTITGGVWTGTLVNGGIDTFNTLGNDTGPNSRQGFAQFQNSIWVNDFLAGNATSNPLYGMSSVLSVPQAQSTPEPGSLLGFITLGGLMLGSAVRRARK